MTPSVNPTLADRLKRIEAIAQRLLDQKKLGKADSIFLGNALLAILSRSDPSVALDIKAKPGEKRTGASKAELRRVLKPFIHLWISNAMQPKAEAGLELSRDEAIFKAAEFFNGIYSDETLRKDRSNNKDLRKERLLRR